MHVQGSGAQRRGHVPRFYLFEVARFINSNFLTRDPPNNGLRSRKVRNCLQSYNERRIPQDMTLRFLLTRSEPKAVDKAGNPPSTCACCQRQRAPLGCHIFRCSFPQLIGHPADSSSTDVVSSQK